QEFLYHFYFFCQAEDGIRDRNVTGVQTCALPIYLTKQEYLRDEPSATFHGRDIFAPAAAHLSRGVELQDLGEPIDELVSYRWMQPIADKDGLEGTVIHIDKFGNLVTNISGSLIDEAVGNKKVKIYVGIIILNILDQTFGEVAEGEPVAYIGSAGMLEVGINKGYVEQMLGVQKGAQLSIILQKEHNL